MFCSSQPQKVLDRLLARTRQTARGCLPLRPHRAQARRCATFGPPSRADHDRAIDRRCPDPSSAPGREAGDHGFFSAPTSTPARLTPLASERYKVQFTVTRETYDKLRRAQDLLRHVVPNGDPAAIFDRALTLLVAELERAKLAATDRPHLATTPPREHSRHISAAVKRMVWARDGSARRVCLPPISCQPALAPGPSCASIQPVPPHDCTITRGPGERWKPRSRARDGQAARRARASSVARLARSPGGRGRDAGSR